MLWLCVHLPRLSLDVARRGDQDDTPLAIVEGTTILTANRIAAEAGVRAGMQLTAAQALLPGLHRRERDQAAEAHALERLAGWSLQWTSRVSLQPPRSLLLEIGGSQRYFGGLETLRSRLREGLEAIGYRHVLAVAPTPTAAWLLALAGRQQPVTREDRLEQALASLPAAALDLDEEQREALESLGLYTLGDCFALPRGALARRLGAELLRQLDRARGHLAEPRRSWCAPPRFRSGLELPSEVHEIERLLFGLNRLILELCGYLQGMEAGIQRLHVRLCHLHRPPTCLSVGLVVPSRDAGHLLELARQRLERLRLSAPVIGLSLSARDIQHLPPRHRSLDGEDRRHDAEHPDALIERLLARLGERAVQGIQVREAHRPEYAWRYAPAGRKSPITGLAERPLWLLLQPLCLETRDGQPSWRGPLVLQHGPERIESGWWDGRDIVRDYYIARSRAGERVWVFRERRGGAWYLHGVFA